MAAGANCWLPAIRDLRIVLVGKTGTGKSAVGNSILGRGDFISKPSANPVTIECKEGSCVKNGEVISVIDTPGLFDPKGPNSVIAREIAKCVIWAAPGPHAFVLVMQAGRFTPEEAEAVRDIQTLFGEEANKFMIVVFTRTDDLEYAGMTLEAYIQESDSRLRAVIDACGGRYLGFNNRAGEEERERQVEALISMVQEMVRENMMTGKNDMLSEKPKGLTKGSGIRNQTFNNRAGENEPEGHYTNTMFEKALEEIEKREGTTRRDKKQNFLEYVLSKLASVSESMLATLSGIAQAVKEIIFS